MPRILLKTETCDTRAALANLEKDGDYWLPRGRGRALTAAEYLAVTLDNGRCGVGQSKGQPNAAFFIEQFGAWWAQHHGGELPAVLECRTFFESDTGGWVCNFVVNGVVDTPDEQNSFVVSA